MFLLLAASVNALSITSPANNAVVSHTITLGSSCANCTSVSYSVDGMPFFGSDGSFNAVLSTTSFIDGTHTIYATGQDVNGTENASVQFVTDNTAPVISLSSNGNTVVYSFSDAHFAMAYLESNASGSFTNTSVTQNGSFIMSASGSVKFVVIDSVNNSAQSTISVAVVQTDTVNPVVTLVQYSTMVVSSSGNIRVNYSFVEDHPFRSIVQFINSTGAVSSSTVIALSSPNDSRSDLVSFNLPTGIYSINVVVNDTSGNQGNNLRSNILYADGVPPNVSFSLYPVVVGVGGTITPTCTATDDSQAYGGAITTEIRNVQTNAVGRYTAICVGTDTAGNEAYATAQYDVNSSSSVAQYNYTSQNSSSYFNYTQWYNSYNQQQANSSVGSSVNNSVSPVVSANENAAPLVHQLDNATAESTAKSPAENLSTPLLSKFDFQKYKWHMTVLAIIFTVVIIIFVIYMMSRPKSLNDELEKDIEDRAKE